MSKSLRDQLLGLGYAPAPKPEPAPARRPADVRNPRSDANPGRNREGRVDNDRRPPGKPQERRDGQPAPRTNGQPAPRTNGRPAQRADGKPAARHDARPANAGRPDPRRRHAPRSQEEIDLGKAYALRAQKEKDDRIEAERLKQEEAKKRREAKALVGELVKDKALNDPAADIARHFEYGAKIKRIHVTAEQLRALNAGELGVGQLDGRYLLLPIALLTEAGTIFPPFVALKVDPDAPATDDPYSDPAYQVPDDLVW